MDKIQQALLAQIADLHGVPEGAYNIRSDGATAARATTANIDIVTKTDKQGIDIYKARHEEREHAYPGHHSEGRAEGGRV